MLIHRYAASMVTSMTTTAAAGTSTAVATAAGNDANAAVIGGGNGNEAAVADGGGGSGNTGTVRRNRPGTKGEEFCRWVEEPFEEMDSTLAVQQHIQQVVRKDVAAIEDILGAPETQVKPVNDRKHL